MSPFLEALERLKKLVQQLQEETFDIRYVDLGGGLGITYDQEAPPHPAEYAQAILAASEIWNAPLFLNPDG